LNCGIEKDEILTSHNTLLRMTGWVDEIATSSNQRTVVLLAMTEQKKLKGEGTKISRPIIPSPPLPLGVFRQYSLAPWWERVKVRGNYFLFHLIISVFFCKFVYNIKVNQENHWGK